MAADKLYRIRDWDEHFETTESRKRKALAWVAIPNKHDGKGFRRLMRQSNGPSLFAAWVLIIQVASKCPIRGALVDTDGPLTADDLETKTDCPAHIFTEALEVLCEIGWIEWDSYDSAEAAASSAATAVLQDRTLQDRTKQEKGCSESAAPTPEPLADVPPFSCDGKRSEWRLTKAKLDEWQAVYPSLNCLAECRKARQWIEDNPSRRKTFGGMIRFLGNWLARAQNSNRGVPEADKKEHYQKRISLAEQERRKRAAEDAAAKASWGEGGYQDLAKKIGDKKP